MVDFVELRAGVLRLLYREFGYAVCVVCGRSLDAGGPVEMHEHIITRGDWSGVGTDDIFDPCNCVLLHRHCHFKAQWSRDAKNVVTRYLMSIAGFHEWETRIGAASDIAAQEIAYQKQEATKGD